MFIMLKNSKHTSIEKRVHRTIVAKTFKREFVQSKKKILKTYSTRANRACFYPSINHDIQLSSDNMLVTDIINALAFEIGVQSYSNINHIVNFHIEMSKPNRGIMVIPDKLLLDEVNKKDIGDNEIIQQLSDFADVECKADIARILLEMQLNNQIDDANNQLSNQILDDLGESSDVSYNGTEDEIESDSNANKDLDNNFYNVEDMLNAQVFDTSNQDIYNVGNFIKKVKIES